MSSQPLRLALMGDGDHINIQRWAAGLRAAGAETIVLSLSTRRSVPRSDTFRLPTFQSLGRLNYILAVPSARRFLRYWRPDVVLAYYVTGYGTLGRLCGFRPLVQVTSGSDVLLAPRNFLMRSIVQGNLKAADLVTAWAPHMAKAAYELGADNVFVLPAGIMSEAFRSHRIPEPKPDDALRLVSTRALKASYRIDLQIETMHVLKEKRVPSLLTIAGNGPERERLQDLVDKYGLGDQIRLVGYVENHALPALLAQHNMYISLVPSDGVSASLLEAMAAGLLPLVVSHPANSEWITHGTNGFLLDSVTPETVAATIECADHALRRRAWQRNPDLVSERADLYRNAEVYVDRFRQLVRDR